MKTSNINVSVSKNTLRTDTLIHRFAAELYQLSEASYVEYASMRFEDDDDRLDELFNRLDDLAPEGTYFGAHIDDGADFGFWSF